MIAERAYAKINLYLDVVGRRDDGFHNISSIMHSLSLADELTFEFTPCETVEVLLEIVGNDLLPKDDSNLVVKAAKKYLESVGKTLSVKVLLEKNIPSSAGLAGGSSDAAATLRALNCYFDEMLTAQELFSLASELGSDVPYCLLGGTALCEGRGEIITPLKSPAAMYFVVAKGEGEVSTPRAFAKLDELYSDFNGSNENNSEQQLISLLEGIEKGNLAQTPLYNIFEEAVMQDMPVVGELKGRLISLGASSALMSGSGPSVFAIFDTHEAAEAAAEKLRAEGIFAIDAQSVD